jgi:hypothetical protein
LRPHAKNAAVFVSPRGCCCDRGVPHTATPPQVGLHTLCLGSRREACRAGVPRSASCGLLYCKRRKMGRVFHWGSSCPCGWFSYYQPSGATRAGREGTGISPWFPDGNDRRSYVVSLPSTPKHALNPAPTSVPTTVAVWRLRAWTQSEFCNNPWGYIADDGVPELVRARLGATLHTLQGQLIWMALVFLQVFVARLSLPRRSAPPR